LQPGEIKKVEIALNRFAGDFWHEILDNWVVEAGDYEMLVGKSSKNSVLKGTWNVDVTKTWSGL